MGFWNRIVGWLSTLDTLEARKGVADDLRKMAKVLFGLLLINIPGLPTSIAELVAKRFDVASGMLHISTGSLVALGVGAFLLRSAAFLLECSIPEEARHKLKKKKHHV